MLEKHIKNCLPNPMIGFKVWLFLLPGFKSVGPTVSSLPRRSPVMMMIVMRIMMIMINMRIMMIIIMRMMMIIMRMMMIRMLIIIMMMTRLSFLSVFPLVFAARLSLGLGKFLDLVLEEVSTAQTFHIFLAGLLHFLKRFNLLFAIRVYNTCA